MTEMNTPLLFLSRRQFHQFACKGKVNVSVDTNAALDAAKNGLTNPPNLLLMLTASWALPILFVVLAIAVHPAFLLLALPPLYLVKVGREKCRAALLQKCFENDKVYDLCIKNMYIVITSDDSEVKRADMINSVDGVENADKKIEVEPFVDSFTKEDDEEEESTQDPYVEKVITALRFRSPEKFLLCLQTPPFIIVLSKYITACKELDVPVRDCIICLKMAYDTTNDPVEIIDRIDTLYKKMK